MKKAYNKENVRTKMRTVTMTVYHACQHEKRKHLWWKRIERVLCRKLVQLSVPNMFRYSKWNIFWSIVSFDRKDGKNGNFTRFRQTFCHFSFKFVLMNEKITVWPNYIMGKLIFKHFSRTRFDFFLIQVLSRPWI